MKTRSILIIIAIGIISTTIGVFLFQQTDNQNFKYPPPADLTSLPKNCNKAKDIPDMTCFLDSFRECTLAKIEQTKYTDEGDPITVTAVIEKTDKSECKIHAYYDSKDRRGFYGKYDSLCSRLESQNEFSWIIDQCENKDYSFGVYNK